MLTISVCGCAGDPVETVPALVKQTGAGLLVTDFAPLRLGRQWRDGVSGVGALCCQVLSAAVAGFSCYWQ